MKKMLIVCIAFIISSSLFSQEWLHQLQTDSNGRPSYKEACGLVKGLRAANPDAPIAGEKQLLRASFLLEHRIDADGSLPSGLFWNECKSVVSQRTRNKSELSPWSFIGPKNSTVKINTGVVGGSGRIDCITFHPTNPDLYYVGAPSGGLWRTTDNGITWEVLTDDLPVLGISDVDLHPNDPNTIYICTGTRDVWWETYTIGILKSEDGGETWNETGLQYSVLQNQAVHELWINPSNPDFMLAAASNGLYKSADGGDNWTFVRAGNFMELEQIPGNSDIVFATTFNYSGGARIFRSDDGGQSFSYINNGIPTSDVNRISIAVTPADPNKVYALYSRTTDNGFYGVWVSNDAGLTWIETPNSNNMNPLGWQPSGTDAGGQGYFTLSLSVDPADPMHLHVGGVNIWESLNGGETWQLQAQYYGGGAQYIHADIHTLAYNPLNQEFYATTDGGVYQLVKPDNLWTNRSDGLEIMQFYRVGLFHPNPDRLMGSPQDNGSVLFTDTICYEVNMAEACDNFFDPLNGDTMYFGGYAAGIRRSYNGGFNYINIIPPGESKYRFNPPFLIHPTEAATIYCAYKDVWKSTNRGTQWTNLSNGLASGDDFESLEVYSSDDRVIWAATYSNIWRTTDGGATWQFIRDGLPTYQSILDIALSDKNPDHAWVVMGNFIEGQKVYRTTDGGATWQNVSGSLPNVPTNCITYEPGSNDALYVGNDIGVFYTNNDLPDWIDYSRDLPAVIIDELEVHKPTSTVVAATYGRGMWKNSLADPLTVSSKTISEPTLTVYPNPATDRINVEWLPPAPGKFDLRLTDASGRVVMSKSIFSTGMDYRTTINCTSLVPGLYVLRILGSNYSNDHKISIINR